MDKNGTLHALACRKIGAALLASGITAMLLSLPGIGKTSARAPLGVTIDSLRADDHIWGHVAGGKAIDYGTLKVVVYVRTDKWYVHPYEREGEGSSWAAVEANGNWSIPTVKRQYPASRVGVVLARRNWRAPAQPAILEELPAGSVVALAIFPGTGDL